jgi:hypothetical protein
MDEVKAQKEYPDIPEVVCDPPDPVRLHDDEWETVGTPTAGTPAASPPVAMSEEQLRLELMRLRLANERKESELQDLRLIQQRNAIELQERALKHKSLNFYKHYSESETRLFLKYLLADPLLVFK